MVDISIMDGLTFFLYLFALIFSFVLGICSIWWVGMANATKRYIEESKKLQLKLNQARQIVEDFSEKPQDAISTAIGGLGVDGIMDAFGVPAIFKPIAKGFIEKVTSNPELLKGIMDKLGVKVNVPSKESTVASQV
jgi:hypothetical protein